jgi:hypothetical protein
VFMDIEGCELEVLHDLQSFLRTTTKRPIVYLELHRVFYGEAGVDWLRMFCDRNGYSSRVVGTHLLCVPVQGPRGTPVARFNQAAVPSNTQESASSPRLDGD